MHGHAATSSSSSSATPFCIPSSCKHGQDPQTHWQPCPRGRCHLSSLLAHPGRGSSLQGAQLCLPRRNGPQQPEAPARLAEEAWTQHHLHENSDWNPTGHQFWISQGTWHHYFEAYWVAGSWPLDWKLSPSSWNCGNLSWERDFQKSSVGGPGAGSSESCLWFSITAQKVFISCWQHVQPMRLPVSELSIMGLTYEERLNELNM